MGYFTRTVRFLFLAFNFVFFCLGVAVLAVGVYSRLQDDAYRDVIESTKIAHVSKMVIAAGIIGLFISFLGCFGAWKRSNWLLASYAILFIIIIIMEVVTGIYAYSKRNTIEDSLTNNLKVEISKNYGRADVASERMTKSIDWFQWNVKCCGVHGPRDWRMSRWYASMNTTQDTVPMSCCKIQTAGCNVGMAYNETNIFSNGCVEQAKKFVSNQLWVLGMLSIGIAIVELLGVIFSITLCKTYQNEERCNYSNLVHTEK